jgi:hypothetical protein
MNAVLSMGSKFMFMIYAGLMAVKLFIANEIKRIKNDEKGIEVVQVVLILLIVVIIAAVLWFLLRDLITDWIARIFESDGEIGGSGDIYGGGGGS